jgi:predicted Fe-Mo cluster-binding NifX family protein
MRIAVTSQDFRTVTGHAGRARRFLIFETRPGAEPAEVGRLDLPRAMAFKELHDQPHPVDAADVLMTQSAGPGFARRLSKRGVRLVLTSEKEPFLAVARFLEEPNQPLPGPGRGQAIHGSEQ